MNKFYTLIFSTFLFGNIFSQTSKLGKPIGFNTDFAFPKNTISLPKVNNNELKSFYEEKSKETREKNMQYGFVHDVNFDLFSLGAKKTYKSKHNIYHLRLKSESAVSLNIIFKEFKLEEGTILYLFSSDKRSFIGAYTSLNNNANNTLGTDLLFSDDIVLEVVEPKQNEGKSKLVVESVVHGFININHAFDKALNESGFCNIDVNCPQGSPWAIQRNSVAMLVNNTGGFCTGAMVNNTSGQLIPYFLTANHCGNSPTNWVFRFRWESPSDVADCGTNTLSGNGPESMNINGGITRAKYSPSDFHLIELNTAPPSEWEVTYCGWDKSENVPSSGAGIHHPSGDIKKISVSSSEFESASYTSQDQDHWLVRWSEGVTEGGSSGSPIFNQQRRIVGQLHGGASGCGSNDQSDLYGKFSVSWEGGGSPSNRLKDWLDPQETGVETLDANISFNLDPYFASNIIGIEKSTTCEGVYNPKIVLSNSGNQTLTSAMITYIIDGNSTIIDWTGNLDAFETDTITFPTLNLSSGEHTFTVTVSNPNNSTDDLLTNNMFSTTFFTVLGGYIFNLELNLDCYSEETSWNIVSPNNVIVHESPFYESNNDIPYTVNQSICLTEGCYKFNLFDSYGDGLADPFQCETRGSYYFTNSFGDTLALLPPEQANFGSKNIENFCVGNYASLTEINQSAFTLFPNPFNDEITINSNYMFDQFSIFDLNGKQIDFLNFEPTKIKTYKIDLSKGIYQLIIKRENSIISNQKIVKF